MPGARKPRSGPRKLTQEVHETIVRHLKAGAFAKHACTAAGIDEDTFGIWMKRAAAGDKRYTAFAADVRRVQAEDAIRSQSVVTRAQLTKIDGDWKAAAWNLERKYPKLYGAAAAAAQVGVTIEPANDGSDEHNGTRTRVEFYIPSNGRRPGESSTLTDDDEDE
jgi:hypothetical protein